MESGDYAIAIVATSEEAREAVDVRTRILGPKAVVETDSAKYRILKGLDDEEFSLTKFIDGLSEFGEKTCRDETFPWVDTITLETYATKRIKNLGFL